MTKLLYLFSILLFQLVSIAQDGISAFYDSDWNECKKVDAFYFRVKHKVSKVEWLIKDYYSTGELQMVGFYKDKKCQVKQGDFYFYYKNGQLEKKVYYHNNLLEGSIYGYFDDGNISEEGAFKSGKKNGLFKYYYKSGSLSWYEQIRMDTIVFRQCWNDKGQELDTEFPSFVDAFIAGGSRSLYFLIEENFSYPDAVKSKAFSVELEVIFVVSKDGDISNVRVEGTKESWICKEVIRVFNLMPKWYPALDHMRSVESIVRIPLLIKHLAK